MTDMDIGGRIRRLRRQRHFTQADFAEALGISASYLNLIEHNRRKVTVQLLFAIASRLGVEPGDLAESDDGRLGSELMEVFGDDIFADADLTNLEIRDFARSSPALGRAVVALYARFRAGSETGMAPMAAMEAPYHVATEAISDFLEANLNHFAHLEAVAERVRADIDTLSDDFASGLRAYLDNVFGLSVRLAALPSGVARQSDPARNGLLVSDLLTAESAQFTIAQHLAMLVGRSQIDAIIDEAGLPAGDAPALARNVLTAYLAAALIMPYVPFLGAARTCRYDIERLGRRFGTSFEQVCHRLTTLQRPGQAGVPFHLVRTDIAGNISKRFSLSGIHIPRHSGACPRWNVYSAFLSPERINIQLSEMPDGARYFCVARTVTKGDFRHNGSRRYFSIGLGCAIEHASQLVYSDGIDMRRTDQIVPVGVGCRICPRLTCSQRAHPPADHRFRLEDGIRPESLYGRMG